MSDRSEHIKPTADTVTVNAAPTPTNPKGPAGYTWCANENGSYEFSQAVDVAYGANGQFSYKQGVTGTITFDNATFGDPIYGVVKSGYYKARMATNIALGKPTSQSSTAYGDAGVSSWAVDGNPDGNWYSNSVTHTNADTNAWWQVDLGWDYFVEHVTLWNRTDCCSERLSNFHVDFLDARGHLIAKQDHPGAAGPKTDFAVSVGGVRTVRVQFYATGILSLAEVQVFGVGSLSRGKAASQSSTVFGGDASRAVDGNTDGNWYDNSVTHTAAEAQPWWKVDLGTAYDVDRVTFWNRTDCCSERLSDFHVDFLDANGNVLARRDYPGQADVRTDIEAKVDKVRTVRIQLNQAGHLSLAEVQVFGKRVPLGIDYSDAIPLKCDRFDPQFCASLTGNAMLGPSAYKINFDTGSSQCCIPYGALNKQNLTVLQPNVRTCWGNLADYVKGQLAMTSRDGRTTYFLDDYPFYAMKNEDGSDMGAGGGIMGAFVCPESFPYALAKKYSPGVFAYGIITEAPSENLVPDWDNYMAYLKIGNDPNIVNHLNWYQYESPWFDGQTDIDFITFPGWTVTYSFPSVNGTTLPDIVLPNQIATIDTGAPDLSMRLGSNDPHRTDPYQQFFSTDGVPWWYGPEHCRAAKIGVTVQVCFTGSSGETHSYKWTISDNRGAYIPSGALIGDWSAGIPWGGTPGSYFPPNRFNLGNSIYFFNQVHYWDVTNKRVGFYFR